MRKIVSILVLIIICSCSPNENGGSLPYDENADPDRDGVINKLEDRNGDGNPKNDDTDGDGHPDYRDPDDDGDGILTKLEDKNQNNNFLDDDTDYDGKPDYLDAVLFADWINGDWKLMEARLYKRSGNAEQELKVVNGTQMTYKHDATYSNPYHEAEYVFEGKLVINFPKYNLHKKYYDLAGNLVNENTYSYTFSTSELQEGKFNAELPIKYVPPGIQTNYLSAYTKFSFENLETLKFNFSTNTLENNYLFVRQ